MVLGPLPMVCHRIQYLVLYYFLFILTISLFVSCKVKGFADYKLYMLFSKGDLGDIFRGISSLQQD